MFAAKRVALWGLVWGVAVAVIEALAFSPLQTWSSQQVVVWWLFYWVAPLWCASGCLFIFVADRAWHSAGARGVLAAYVAVSVVTAALQPALAALLSQSIAWAIPSVSQAAVALGVVPKPARWSDMAAYALWVNLFYGGLLMVAYVFTVRTERTRSLLHTNAMAHSRIDALADEERLRALQGQIDPQLLLESLQDLEHFYRTDPGAAERLLEALVEFLRAAMQGLNNPVSTLAAEVRLASCYAQLQRDRGIGESWRVDELAHSAAPFPSLLVLPLLALGGRAGRPMLTVQSADGATTLSLEGLVRGASPELLQQLRARLRVLYGERFRVDCLPDADSLAICLMVS
jgi:hypothetical protein